MSDIFISTQKGILLFRHLIRPWPWDFWEKQNIFTFTKSSSAVPFVLLFDICLIIMWNPRLYKYCGYHHSQTCWQKNHKFAWAVSTSSLKNNFFFNNLLVKIDPKIKNKKKIVRSAGIKWKEAENGLKSELFWCFIVLYPPLQCHHQRAARSRGSSRWWCNAHGLGHCRKKDRKFIFNKINNSNFLSRVTPWLPQLHWWGFLHFLPNCCN